MQEARLEGLGGHKILAKACNLAGVGMLAWEVVLDWVRVWDNACQYSVC